MDKDQLLAGAAARVFLPITKVDSVLRLVYARITDETVDAAKEICDYETSKPFWQKWSETAEKVTGGKSKGNLRAMHGPKAAGKLTHILFDDDAKAIDCVAKVVDDAEWEKVVEGVYTGLSLGGNYVGKKWKDADTGAQRYTVDPVEVSLVDLPCNPSATFAMVKGEGLEPVLVTFHPWEPSATEVAQKATAIWEAIEGKPGDFTDHLDAGRQALIDERATKSLEGEQEPAEPAVEVVEGDSTEVAAAGEDTLEGQEGADKIAAAEPTNWGIDQVFRVAADGSVHDKKADAKAHIEKLQAVEEVGGADLLAQAIAKAQRAATPAAEPAEGEVALALKVVTPGLDDMGHALAYLAEKGKDSLVIRSMWDVGRFAEVLQALSSIQRDSAWEAEYEGDGSSVPAKIAAGIRALGDAFLTMATEEVGELLENLRLVEGEEDISVILIDAESDAIVTAAARAIDAVKGDPAVVEKIGARNSTADAGRIQAIHDLATKLGGACAEKHLEAEVTKVAGERDALKAQIEGALPQIAELGETVAKMAIELETTKASLAKVSAEPAPMPVVPAGSEVLSRSGAQTEVSTETAAKALAALIENFGTEEVSKMMVREAQRRPIMPTA
jgi:hypothetical protein